MSTAAFGDDVLCVTSSFEALCEKVELAEAWSWVFKAVLGINGTTKTTWGALEWDEATGTGAGAGEARGAAEDATT